MSITTIYIYYIQFLPSPDNQTAGAFKLTSLQTLRFEAESKFLTTSVEHVADAG